MLRKWMIFSINILDEKAKLRNIKEINKQGIKVKINP